MQLELDDFDYPLPPQLIAQHPPAQRTAGRLLLVDGARCEDRLFRDLQALLRAGDLLILNDTRVIQARLLGVKDSGGRVEVLIERQTADHEALAQVRASHAPKLGSRLRLEDALDATVLGREGDFFRLSFPAKHDLLTLLERHGKLPLPPYIERPASLDDRLRYQTVYAHHPGSVAAPTAGLHFDEPMLDSLRAGGVGLAYVTLHIGAGTFVPVRTRKLAQHRMHRERYFIPEATVHAVEQTRRQGGRIVVVGTTSLRALESAARYGTICAGEGETDLFILPGFEFRVADRLITNFHRPKSTLLMLVSAFGGLDNMRRAYRHAVAQHYRFFSYGDAMFIAARRP